MAREWTADELLRLCRGFQPACVVIAAAELDVFSALKGGPAGAATLAARIGGDARATAVLLDALAAMGLLEKRGNEYHVLADVAELLTEDSPKNVLGIVRHLGNCMRRWAQLAEVVRTGTPAERRPSVRGAAGDTESFIRGMQDVSAPRVAEIVQALQPLTFTHLLDVGGGCGTWTVAFLQAAPEATATLFDLPEVIGLARARIAAAGLSGRVKLAAGDFYTDALPAGADFAWVSSIAHQNSREQNVALLGKVHAALAAGGQVVLRDVVMGETRTEPPAGALFAVNMLAGTPGGRTYTFAELAGDLASAGFAGAVLLRQGESTDSLVRAVKA